MAKETHFWQKVDSSHFSTFVIGLKKPSMLSFTMCYSILFFIMISILSYFAMRDVILHLFYQENDFLSITVNIVTIMYIFLTVYIPIVCWFDVQRVIQHLQDWTGFQEMFFEVTQNHLKLYARKSATTYVILSVLSFLPVMYFAFYLPHPTPCIVTSFFFYNGMNSSCGSFWAQEFKALSIAGNSVYTRFKNDQREQNIMAAMVADYRLLWLRLSHLVMDSGGKMGKMMLSTIAMYTFFTTALMYAAVFVGLRGLLISAVGCVIGAAVCVLQFYNICNSANYVTTVVRKNIQEELQLIKHHRVSNDVQKEVSCFLQTISMNPPVISLMDFIDVNRGLFKGFACATVAYLVVMLQFELGAHEEEHNKCFIKNGTK